MLEAGGNACFGCPMPSQSIFAAGTARLTPMAVGVLFEFGLEVQASDAILKELTGPLQLCIAQ